MMDENDVRELLIEAIECMESRDPNFTGPYTNTIQTFEAAEIRHGYVGLVIPFEDGSEFHVLIAKAPKKP